MILLPDRQLRHRYLQNNSYLYKSQINIRKPTRAIDSEYLIGSQSHLSLMAAFHPAGVLTSYPISNDAPVTPRLSYTSLLYYKITRITYLGI